MKARLIALAAAMTLSAAGAASPAQSLFDSVAQLLTSRYGGLSTVDREQLISNHQAKLNAACGDQGEACSFETAFPVIEQKIRELGDHHTNFNRPDAFKDRMTQASGGNRLQYGVKLKDLEGGQQVITEVIPGSTAQEAGLRRGDVLVELDGKPYSFEALRASRSTGTPVQLAVRRADSTFTAVLTARESSSRHLPSIRYEGNVAVLRIPTFMAGGGIGQAVHDLVREAKAQGAQAMLVDLRDNPGGDLRECDMSVSAFVPAFTRVAKTARGDLPTTVARGAFRNGVGTHQGVNNPSLWEGPLAVLVSKGSASCSEFFSYEVQFAQRGTVIGEETSGVGNTATQLMQLPGGAGIQLTTVHYTKPDGTPYAERVKPDVAGVEDYASLARGQDVLLQKGIEVVRTAYANAIR